MSESSTVKKEHHTPLVLVDTEHIPVDEWLAYRRCGIGGSDVAAILGISPFRTARDLYFDKLNIVSAEDNEGNWVAMEMGHLLEDLAAEIFRRKTGTADQCIPEKARSPKRYKDHLIRFVAVVMRIPSQTL